MTGGVGWQWAFDSCRLLAISASAKVLIVIEQCACSFAEDFLEQFPSFVVDRWWFTFLQCGLCLVVRVCYVSQSVVQRYSMRAGGGSTSTSDLNEHVLSGSTLAQIAILAQRSKQQTNW